MKNDIPAFPIPDVRTHDGFGIGEGSPGMTLRDWFAGQALPVVTALLGRDVGTADMLARDAYTIADAMLAARETTLATEPQMQHVGYYDEDGFDWMTGIKPRNCELYAARTGDA